jgi:cytosine deaminase
MAALGVTMTTVAPLRLPPVARARCGRCRLRFGTDGIRDLWSPYGTGDLLGIAWQYARASSIVRDEDLLRVVEIAAGGSALRRLGDESTAGRRPRRHRARGCRERHDALVRTPRREVVIGRGHLLVG